MRCRQRYQRDGRIEIARQCGMQAHRSMRIDHFARVLMRPAQRLQHLILIYPRTGEQPGCAFALGIGQPHRPVRFECAHLRGHRCAVAPAAIEQQPLEIRRNLDVHRGRSRGRDCTGRIIAV